MDPQGSNGLETAHLLNFFNKSAPLLIDSKITGLQVDPEKIGDPQGRFGLGEGNPLIFSGKGYKKHRPTGQLWPGRDQPLEKS